jgi:hypothetical protein
VSYHGTYARIHVNSRRTTPEPEYSLKLSSKILVSNWMDDTQRSQTLEVSESRWLMTRDELTPQTRRICSRNLGRGTWAFPARPQIRWIGLQAWTLRSPPQLCPLGLRAVYVVTSVMRSRDGRARETETYMGDIVITTWKDFVGGAHDGDLLDLSADSQW